MNETTINIKIAVFCFSLAIKSEHRRLVSVGLCRLLDFIKIKNQTKFDSLKAWDRVLHVNMRLLCIIHPRLELRTGLTCVVVNAHCRAVPY